MIYANKLCGVIVAVSIGLSLEGSHENRLYELLLADYNPMVRPVSNESEPVQVRLGIDIQQIIGIDERNQLIHVSVWVKMEWIDIYMKWDPQEYGGVKEIRLPPEMIWKPDVLLYNIVDERIDYAFPTNAVISSNGLINWIPPGAIRSSCKIDITWFPFDDQRCDLKFGTWTHGVSTIDLQVGEIQNATYTENGEWILMEVPVARRVKKYDCCSDPYVDVTFTLWIRRRTLYYGFNLLLPSALISSITLFSFTLPPESGEKLTLSVTIFMSLCIFLTMVIETMPETSEVVPLIEIYFCCIMFVVTASIACTVVVQNFYFRNPELYPMSPLFRSIFLHWLPWILFLKRKPSTSKSYSFMPDLNELLTELRFITDKIKDDEISVDLARDWKFAAATFDRLCLVVFLLFLTISTATILFSAPHLVA